MERSSSFPRRLFHWFKRIFYVSAFALLLTMPVAFVLSTMTVTASGFAFIGAIAVASFVTSLVTLVGLLVTNVIALRRERREVQMFNLELEKKQLEIEKLQSELNEKRGVQPSRTG